MVHAPAHAKDAAQEYAMAIAKAVVLVPALEVVLDHVSRTVQGIVIGDAKHLVRLAATIYVVMVPDNQLPLL